MSLHIVAFEVEDDPDARFFMAKARERASGPGVHNFFAEWIIFPIAKSSYLVAVKSFFPDAWKLGAVMVGLPLAVLGLSFSWWLAPGLLVLGLSFLASSTFRFWTLRIGLRRYGYEGPIRRLSTEDVLAEMFRRRAKDWRKWM